MSMHRGLSESPYTLLIGSGELPTGCLKRKASRSQRLPSAPLLSPVGDGRDRQQVPELNRVPAPESAGQEKDLLLKVGSKAKEAHDLTQPRPADVPQPGQLGVVGHLARANQLVEAHGQGHQSGSTRHTACLGRPSIRWRSLAAPSASVLKLNPALNREGGSHFQFSFRLVCSSSTATNPAGSSVRASLLRAPS